jgi:hypothetical protein
MYGKALSRALVISALPAPQALLVYEIPPRILRRALEEGKTLRSSDMPTLEDPWGFGDEAA